MCSASGVAVCVVFLELHCFKKFRFENRVDKTANHAWFLLPITLENRVDETVVYFKSHVLHIFPTLKNGFNFIIRGSN